MFPVEFATWTDFFLDHYALSVIISVMFVLTTLIVSKMNVNPNVSLKTHHLISSNNASNCKNSENHSIPAAASLTLSPALRAEKVIEANMTEEQRLLEQQVRQKQLAQIYELMQKQSDKFGNVSLIEVEEQMKLYQ